MKNEMDGACRKYGSCRGFVGKREGKRPFG